MKQFIYPAPGVYGMKHQLKAQNSTMITLYCPITFEIFQIRTNQVMTITEFKRKIAQKYDTSADNVILSYGDKEFIGAKIQSSVGYKTLMSKVISNKNDQTEDESKTQILSVVNIEDRSIVKVTFKKKPQGLQAKVTPEVTQQTLCKKSRIH